MTCYVVCPLLAVALVSSACGNGSTGPDPDGEVPPPGSSASTITNASGLGILTLGGVETAVEVVDGAGRPVGGARVGGVVGNEVITLVAADPTGARLPALAVYPVSRVTPVASPTPPDNGPQPLIIEAISLTLLAINIGSALHELTSDPIHQKIVVDEGIIKSCIAGDWNDVLALASVPVGALSKHVLVSVLSKSKAFAVAVEAGATGLSELAGLLGFMDRDHVLPGTCSILVGDADFRMRLIIVSAVTNGGILAQDDRTPSGLFFVEPGASGDDIEVHRIRTATGGAPFITDIAIWDSIAGAVGATTLTDPVLYGVSFSDVYRLNRATGIAQLVFQIPGGGINALAFDRSGVLHAFGQAGHLLVLDRTTGGVQRSVRLSPSVTSSGDLQFLPDGRLLATVTGGLTGDRLVEINPITGAVRTIGDVGYRSVYGLSFFAGTLWGLTGSGDLLSIDAATGVGSRVRSLGFRANGASVGSIDPLGNGMTGLPR